MIFFPGAMVRKLTELIPGVCLCALVAAFAVGLQWSEQYVFGHPYLESLVIAIVLGTALRAARQPSERYRSGIAFSAKILLEIAVVLLGASITASAIFATGPVLLVGIVSVVITAVAASFGIGRLLGLSPKMSMLIACGNAICGNSAIAAVAPVINADSDDVASSIAFTAVFGVIVVLALPLFVVMSGLSHVQYGILAGLTVYAVPQVLAATAPVSLASVQMGTIVKLVRVLMLGPVILLVSLLMHSTKSRTGDVIEDLRLSRLVPWFIVGFVALTTLRMLDCLPQAVVISAAYLTKFLTVISMAALGFEVDVRVLGRVGGLVMLSVTASLAVLIGASLMLIHVLSAG